MGKKITLEQTAEELGISLRSVRRLITSGQLRAVRIGRTNGMVRVDMDDLDAVVHPVIPNHAS